MAVKDSSQHEKIIEKMKKEIEKSRKLNYGEGSISLNENKELFQYKKSINGKRISVYGKSISEVKKKMKEKEKELKDKPTEEQIINTMTLSEAMEEWLRIYKKPMLKATSYDTLVKTFENRIKRKSIGQIRLNCLDSDTIQKYINNLCSDYSYSTIKKCYDALNDFYRKYYILKKVSENPMMAVDMVSREKIKKKTKEIAFFAEDDIKKFIKKAESISDKTGKPVYQFGLCLCANIFLGMRAGELMALKWKDIDFEKNLIHVHDNLQLIRNEEYMEGNDDKKNKYKYELQSLKNHHSRDIPLCEKAKDFLLKQKKYSEFTEPNNYVCCTRDGEHAAINYLSENIKRIEEDANTEVRDCGTHVIRHTCASFYFKKGISVEVIAAILGHSVEICRQTYIHFTEEQKQDAVRFINDCFYDEMID